MKTKELVIMALFAAIGAALHSIIPPFLGGMKPDMMVTIPMTSTFCTRGNSRMPMNIMISIISGFMPPKKGGIME